jgi:uncharacterized protein (TIGR03437 family)
VASVAGPGWNCLGSSCARDDALNPSSSYPPITVTVNVALSAAFQVTNQVAVSGGGAAPVRASDVTTVLAPLAGAPTLLLPANGATGVTLAPTLSWAAPTGAASYFVYFGTSSTPPLVTSTTGTGYAPGTVSPGTTYYWGVIAVHGSAFSNSPTWSFKTGQAVPAASGYIISTVAGNGTYGYSGDGGQATASSLAGPQGVAVDAHGNIYIVENLANRARKVSPNGIITTVAGNGTQGYSGDGGPATNAELSLPNGVAVDASGNLYIADTLNSRIRKVSPNGVISTTAGNGTQGYSGDGGPATSAALDWPHGVAVDPSANIYIADTLNGCVRKATPAGIMTTMGSAELKLSGPQGVAVDASGNIYIADGRIFKVTPDGTVAVVAGNGLYGFSGDGGLATGASLGAPDGVAVGADGSIYIADTQNFRVRKVSPSGTITTIAGNGTLGYSGDGDDAANAELFPVSVAVDASGNVYVADEGGNAIRRLTPAAGPAITVVNGASHLAAPLAPGIAASVLGSFSIASPSSAPGFPLPASLAGVSVQLGGISAPLYYVSAGEIRFQVPWESVGQAAAALVVVVNGKASAPQTVSLAPFAPGVFTTNGQGTGQGAVYDAQSKLVDASNPTTAGAVVQIYCTGLGAVTNQPTSASPAPGGTLAVTLATPTVTIGGVPAPVLFSGLAPGTAGTYQLNAQVPAGIATGGAVPITVSIGGATSNSVTIAVK